MEVTTPSLFVLLCFLFNAVSTQSVAGPKPNMSKEDAANHCFKKKSNLLSYKQIKANPSVHDYQIQLNDGESAWIDGYAKLSPFLSWQGCYNTSDLKFSILIVAIRYESVNRCIGACQNYKTYQYIGLKSRSCYCINDVQRSAIQNYAVNDSFCSFPCQNNAVDSCGGISYMAVYSILEDSVIHWAANEPSSHLCVYVKRKVDHFDVYTASCHTLSPLIHGYICSNSAWSRLSTENCSSVTYSERYCIQKVISSRQDASTGCYRRRGILADIGAEKDTTIYLESNYRYWIGIHRTFGISEQIYKPTETVCLSATRLGDKLILEPDDCSAQKFYLCESDFTGKTETTPTSTTTFSRNTENRTFLTTETPPELVTEGKAESPVPYIIPSILIVILIILVILFIIYRRNKRKNETTRPIEDNYDAIYEADNMRNEYSVTSDSSMNADSKCLIVKTKPDKPERQTLKRRTAVSEYENCSLNLKTKEMTNKSIGGHDDEYDKLKFNSVPQTVQYGPEEHNVYNHTMAPGNDNYDTMKSVKSFHSVDRIDETYSRMNENLIPNDFCRLQNTAEPLVNLDGIDNVSYSTQAEGNRELQREDPSRRFIIIDDENENMATKANDNQPEHIEIGDHINYTDIKYPNANSSETIEYTEVGALSKTSGYSDIADAEHKSKHQTAVESHELELTDKRSESRTPFIVDPAAIIDDTSSTPNNEKLDAMYARVQKDSKEIGNVYEKPLNYVDVDLSDTDD